MPLYEYQCDACGRRFEVIQKFSDAPVETCKHCGQGPVQKLLSSPAIQFKGSGWYITDYAKKGSGATTPSGKTDAGQSASSGDSGQSDAAKSETPKSDTAKSDTAKSGTTKSGTTKSDSGASGSTSKE